MTTTHLPRLEPLETVRAGVLAVAYQARPADGGHSSLVPERPSSPVKGDPPERRFRPLSTPEGPGSVSGAPNLPAGFTDTFNSRYVDAGELRQHAVIGGQGPR